MKYYSVYIMASRFNGTLYTGITSNLVRRVYEHRNGLIEGFTKQYNLKNLVYYEIYEEPQKAIEREKHIKGWKRDWKIKLIEKKNPHWKDLYGEII